VCLPGMAHRHSGQCDKCNPRNAARTRTAGSVSKVRGSTSAMFVLCVPLHNEFVRNPSRAFWLMQFGIAFVYESFLSRSA
jgi:hypothetical protein